MRIDCPPTTKENCTRRYLLCRKAVLAPNVQPFDDTRPSCALLGMWAGQLVFQSLLISAGLGVTAMTIAASSADGVRAPPPMRFEPVVFPVAFKPLLEYSEWTRGGS